MLDWQYWLIFSLVIFILEIFVPGFVLAAMGIGGAVATIFAFIGFSTNVQILVFCIFALVGFFLIKPLAKMLYSKNGSTVKTGVGDLAKKTAKVTEEINNVTESGRVQVMGESWKAISENGEIISVDEVVEVVKLEDLRLIVKKRI